jgi:predicted adenine nucleotide alpha hydrolase (AANH) superfamily ATPase
MLREEGIEPVGYWYNPNIHPYTEYRSRKETLIGYAKDIGMKLEVNNAYALRPFLRAMYPDFGNRCETCYRIRLDETARFAAQQGFDSFSTTLLISPYQDHELIVRVGKEVAAAHGVDFLYRDFRPQFRRGQEIAREKGLYMQKYCGCIFSEEERYRKQKVIP